MVTPAVRPDRGYDPRKRCLLGNGLPCGLMMHTAIPTRLPDDLRLPGLERIASPHMAEYGVSTDIPAGTRRVATALLLVLVGGALAFFDVDFDALPLVPDPLGHALVAIAGVQLASRPVTGSLGGQRLRAVGRAMAIVAALSAVAWLATAAAGPPPSGGAGGTRLGAALLVPKVAVGV